MYINAYFYSECAVTFNDERRVARFFLVQNTKTGKNTKLPQTIPNVHKI
jgi:hypothetical protein